MAYEKQTWECGDVVTAEKLNHIEEGIESASESGGDTVETKIVTITASGTERSGATTLRNMALSDATYQEIREYIDSDNTNVIFHINVNLGYGAIRKFKTVQASTVPVGTEVPVWVTFIEQNRDDMSKATIHNLQIAADDTITNGTISLGA